MNGDSKRTNERVHSWLVRWASHAGTRDFCSALAALAGPVQNTFFLTVDYSNSFVQYGQAAVMVRMSFSVYVSGYGPHIFFTRAMFKFNNCLRIKCPDL